MKLPLVVYTACLHWFQVFNFLLSSLVVLSVTDFLGKHIKPIPLCACGVCSAFIFGGVIQLMCE